MRDVVTKSCNSQLIDPLMLIVKTILILLSLAWNGSGPGPRFTNGFFHRNSNSMEISFHSHLDSNTVIATKFCTWHDSCAVVACAKICCDLMASNGITARRSFHRIWIAGKKSLVKRAPAVITLNTPNQYQYILCGLWAVYCANINCALTPSGPFY